MNKSTQKQINAYIIFFQKIKKTNYLHLLYKNTTTIFLLLSILLFTSCNKKESNLITHTKATFTIKVKNNNINIEWGEINNTNLAGNKYSLNTLNLYISNITLKGEKQTYTSKKIFYIDPKTEQFSTIVLDSIPTGSYQEVTFNIGIDENNNKTNALSSTMENANMAWPDMMGGGYHFLKMEGHYTDINGVSKGYAIHLGNNKNLALATINYPLIQLDKEQSYTLFYNAEEVFANPYKYDLNSEKAYTMSDPAAMQLIKNNISDVFSLQQNH